MAGIDEALAARLRALAEPELELLGLDLVDLELLAGGRRLTVRVSVEKQSGADLRARAATIADCARASRAISRRIEAEEAEGDEVVPGRYTIEVGSPGIFRPLRRPEHFARVLGEVVKLSARIEGEEKAVSLRGTLREADAEGVVVEDAQRGMLRVAYDRIRKANLDPDLDFGRKRGQ